MILEKDKVKTFIPYIGGVLITVGYLKISLYYQYFNINVVNYLEFSEILTLFLPDILKYGFILFLGLFIHFMAETKTEALDNMTLKEKFFEAPSFIERIRFYVQITWPLLPMLIMLTVLAFVSYFIDNSNLNMILTNLLFFAMLFFALFIIMEFRLKYMHIYNRDFGPTYFNIVIVFAMLIIFLSNSVVNQIDNVYDEDRINVKFHCKKEQIRTNKDLCYLGQTKKYVFLYNKDSKESVVYDKSYISKFKIFE